MINNFNDNEYMQKGQSMLEAVAALGVIAIVMTALTIAVLLGLGNSGYSKKNNLATQYAQQGMELIRNKRETDGANFWGPAYDPGSYYLGSTDTDLHSISDICSPATVPLATTARIGSSNYIRTVCIVADVSNGCDKKITVSVWWQDGKCPSNGYCKKASITSCFADLRAPTPAL